MADELFTGLAGVLKALPGTLVMSPDCPPELAQALDDLALPLERVESSPSVALSYAAGLAKGHGPVWVLGLSSTLLAENYELWRRVICPENLPLRLLGFAGLTGDGRGVATQCLEDFALVRALDGVRAFVPSSLSHLSRALPSFGDQGPLYVRMSRQLTLGPEPEALVEEEHRGRRLSEGAHGTLIACGIMCKEAQKACEALQSHGLRFGLIECPSPTHLPLGLLVQASRESGLFVVAEEGKGSGGLAEALCLALANLAPAQVVSLCARTSGQSGTSEELLAYYGLTSNDLASLAAEAYSKRRIQRGNPDE